ncbi:MAG TPA: chorismate synthase [Anaerohalosphaeraceae bacterium]|nr:chorismate synthase [Anaerohalosphaeraceae bacterium]
MKIVIAGAKGAGKSTVARELSRMTGLEMIETDALIEEHFFKQIGHRHTCREIYVEHGQDAFRQVEAMMARQLEDAEWKLIVCGGSSLIDPGSRQALRKHAILIYLKANTEVIWARLEKDGLPPWLRGPDAREQLDKNVAFREELLGPFADILVDTTGKTPAAIAAEIVEGLGRELAIRSKAANTYGDVIGLTTFGESHGPAIGAVLDGVRPGLEISAEDIQKELNRRRPGQSDVTTPRDEKDQVEILSGVFGGKTTGAPIAMVIFNRDHDSSKYEGIKDLFRPGHADFTFYKKYGIRDYRGGGRSSGRETAGRVMGGTVVRKLLEEKGVKIVAHAIEIGGVRANSCDYGMIETTPVRCADAEAAKGMEQAILAAKNDNDSVGGIVKLEIFGLPAGLGDPVFGKLDARICHAIMTLGAVKGIEVGKGFELCRMRGSQSNDNMADGSFVSNNAGGITGGISTGQPVYFQIAVKPTSSIAKPQKTIDLEGRNQPIETHGRHDPCIVPRIIPVIEAMTALVLYDCWCIQERIRPFGDKS